MPVVEPGTIQETEGLDQPVVQAQPGGRAVHRLHRHDRPGRRRRHRRVQAEPIPDDQHQAAGRAGDGERSTSASVLLPPRTWQQELQMPERFAKTIDGGPRAGDQSDHPGDDGGRRPASPAPHRLHRHRHGRAVPRARAGRHRPRRRSSRSSDGHELPGRRRARRASSRKLCETMIVIEERRSFLEKNIRDSALPATCRTTQADRPRRAGCSARSSRRRQRATRSTLDGIPETRGLNVSVLAQMLIPLIKATEEIPAAPAQRPAHRRAATASARLSKPKLEVLNDKIDRPHADVLPRLPAPRQLRRAARTPQEPRRPGVHEAQARHAARSTSSPTATPAATRC